MSRSPARRDPDRLLTPTTVAARLGLELATLKEWRCTGRGPAFVKFGGGAVRYRAEDVTAWLAERSRTGGAPP
jgi:predicted DNA-binding transcriptional regulator AlpA